MPQYKKMGGGGGGGTLYERGLSPPVSASVYVVSRENAVLNFNVVSVTVSMIAAHFSCATSFNCIMCSCLLCSALSST